MWSDSKQQCRQLNCLNRAAARSLEEKGVKTLRDLLTTEPRHVEALVLRKYPFGAHLGD